jgi:iron complex outermembrane receptor protein
MYWQPGGNPDLLPEEGYSAEITAIYTAGGEKLSATTSLSGYYSRIYDWILWLPGFKGYWEPSNLKEVRSYGLEYQITMLATLRQTQFRLHGNLAVTQTLNYGEPFAYGDNSHGKQLPFIPRISGNAVFSIANRGFYINLQHSSMGVRYLLSSNSGTTEDDSGLFFPAADLDRMYSLYPHFMNNLTVGKGFPVGGRRGISRLLTAEGLKNGGSPGSASDLPAARGVTGETKKLTVELRIDNLLNESYRNILQRFMPGRSYNLHIKFDF